MVSFTLLLSMVEFKARISAGELDSAMELLPQIPKARSHASNGQPLLPDAGPEIHSLPDVESRPFGARTHSTHAKTHSRAD